MKTCTVDGCNKKHRARGFCVTHYNQRNYTADARHPKVTLPCEVCGTVVERTPGKTYRTVCSSACRTKLIGGIDRGQPNWARDAEARARKLGAPVLESFDRFEIFERDDYTCQICSHPVDLTADPLSSGYPSIDHVVPLSEGGPHSRANVRTTHYGCNSARGARAA